MSSLTIERGELAALQGSIEAMQRQLQGLTEQVTFLSEQARLAEQRQEMWDDLAADTQPIIKDIYDLTVEELSQLEGEFDSEDLLRLARRLAANVRTAEALLEQVESANDLLADLAPLTGEMVGSLTETLATLEGRGYFTFAREMALVLDRIVVGFSEEDIRRLGDNIVLILRTVQAMTQPEIMTMMGNLSGNLQELERHPEVLPTSLMGLARQMRDPEVRRGLAVALAMLRGLAPPAGEGVRDNQN